MTDLKDVTLVLFFTEGVSLQSWWEGGLFERELALYRALLPHLRGISFVTYGNRRDLAYASRLDGIRVVCNRFGLPGWAYKRWISAVYGRTLRNNAVIIKTNQSAGGELALQVARIAGAPLIARGGYLLSDFARRRYGPDSGQLRHATDVERRLFGAAARIVVTTETAAEAIGAQYKDCRHRVQVIPNYVDANRFHPAAKQRDSTTLRACMVGRLEEQKNPLAVIEALVDLDIELVVAGSGPLEQEMRERAATLGVNAVFKGRLPHAELPDLLNACDIYILASHYEGHPKTLLEAMSCGLPVLGAASPGITEVIRDDATGLLVGVDSASIRQGIQRLMSDRHLRDRLGTSARQYIEDTVALERVVAQELQLYADIRDSLPAAKTAAGLLNQ